MDASDRQFGAFDNGYMFVPDELRCALAKMNPNLPIACMVIFEIPADATGLKLKVTSQAAFGDEALISLGLFTPTPNPQTPATEATMKTTVSTADSTCRV